MGIRKEKQKSTTIEKKMKQIERNRNDTYGSIYGSCDSYGRAWAAILSSHYERNIPAIPAHVVSAMLAIMKLHRDVVPKKYNPDNHIDGMNYQSFMPRMDHRSPDSEFEDPDEFEEF